MKTVRSSRFSGAFGTRLKAELQTDFPESFALRIPFQKKLALQPWKRLIHRALAKLPAGCRESLTMRKMNWWSGSMCRVAVFLAAVAFIGAGCAGGIRSVVHIDSRPSGAMVTVNYIERGRTPIDIPILWYWHYQIELEKEGYEKIVKDERFKAPLYAAIPPFDLIVEAIPIPIRNTYRRHYILTPKESD